MRWFKHLQAALFFVILLGVWEAAVRGFDIRAYLLPSPTAVAATGWASRDLLLQNSLVTLNEIVLGFVSAIIGGMAIAIGIFLVPWIQRALYPFIVAVQGIPKVALAPLMVVWLGYGVGSKVLMAFLFAFFPIVISTLGGLYSTPPHLDEHFRALRAGRWTAFWRLRVPCALPNFVDGCKVAMPLTVIGAIVGEFVGSSSGLGNLIVLATGASKTALTFAALGTVTLLSLGLYAIIEYCSRMVWWRGR